jgi:hypothetical protein
LCEPQKTADARGDHPRYPTSRAKAKPSVEYKINLKGLIEGAMITGFNSLVIPGGKMMYAMELILTQRVLDLMKRRGHLGVEDTQQGA